jgi:hypothetical protein
MGGRCQASAQAEGDLIVLFQTLGLLTSTKGVSTVAVDALLRCTVDTLGGQVGKILPYCISHPRYRHLPRYVLYPSQLISLINLEFLSVRELWEASSRNIVG